MSALDLVTLAVLSRMVIEDSIVPRFPSESAPLLAMHRQLEEEAWKLTDEFLTDSQIEDFRNIVASGAPAIRSVDQRAFVHFVDFAKAIGRPKPGEAARAATCSDCWGSTRCGLTRRSARSNRHASWRNG